MTAADGWESGDLWQAPMVRRQSIGNNLLSSLSQPRSEFFLRDDLSKVITQKKGRKQLRRIIGRLNHICKISTATLSDRYEVNILGSLYAVRFAVRLQSHHDTRSTHTLSLVQINQHSHSPTVELKCKWTSNSFAIYVCNNKILK